VTVAEIERDAAARGYRALPREAAQLLFEIAAPPRLVAHHILVHDVAIRLLDALAASLEVDTDVVAFGAATHDIGKALFPAELSGAGNQHERAGRDWMIERGIAPSLARFAHTHGLPVGDEKLELDDLLVVLADKCWKGKRVASLEERVARAAARERDFFAVFLEVDTAVEHIAAAAGARLAWQSPHSV